MKRLVFLCAGFILFLSACGSNETPTITITSPNGQTITVDSEKMPSNDTEKSSPKNTKENCMRGCVMLADKAGMASCEKLCEAGEAFEIAKTGDISVCEKLEGIYQNTCYTTAAESQKNPAFCGKIKDDLYQQTCYSERAKEAKDATICDNIKKGAMLHDQCYVEVAGAKKDPSVCEKIAGSLFYESCVSDAKK